jgi:phosphatidylglycerophosphatase A
MTEGRTLTDRLALLIGQWFRTGLSPVGPGTVGSAGAVPFFWLMMDLSLPVYWVITVATCLVGIPISQRCSELLEEKDPSSVVIDEVAGVFIAMGAVAAAPLHILVLAWVLFRVFDISKPWIIDKAQYWHSNGVGIMADDILAGIVAGALAWGAWQLVPTL